MCYVREMPSARAALLVCLTAAACGKSGSRAATAREDATPPAPVERVVELAARPLGLASVAEYGWRQRAGHAVYRTAREAEARGDWAAVVARCREALAQDPGHLEAAWLLAAALGHLGKYEELAAPLSLAVAGDFGKWGTASLELPALAAFRATSTGEAWRRRVEADRDAYLAALARSTIVNAGGDLFAFDPQLARWHRLTRTGGLVLGGLTVPGTREIAYVARAQGAQRKELGVGVVELARGHTIRPLPVGSAGPIIVAHGAKPAGFWIGAGKPVRWHVLDDARLRPAPAKARRPPGAWLEVKGTTVRRNAVPVATVSADWDEHGLASAIRIGSSKRVVSAPGGLIDGNSAVWSPSKAQLAFVARLDETCTPGAIAAAAYVADAATGRLVELERATNGLAVEWVADRKLAVAGDHGVTIIDLDGAPPVVLAGASNLVAPRPRPICVEPEPLAPAPPASDPE